MGAPAPKPSNFDAMVDAWDQPETFAALVRDYYAMCAAMTVHDAVDITEPRRKGEAL